MSLQDRTVIVENDDASIAYVGNWTNVQASTLNSGGNFGPTFSPTSRSTTSTSSFSFAFNGSSINVVGTVNVANSSTDPNPSWQCFVDGIGLGPPNVFGFFENNWSLCGQGNIPDGAHKLVVNVTSQGMPFYLDNIQYRPSPSVSLEDSLIIIQNNDPAIDYISGWGALGGTANQTTDPNSLVNVTFIGTQLSWYGFIPTEEPHNASSGEYTIDGQPFSSFPLAGLPQSSTTVYNQLFFTTTTLEMGPHTLSAKYTGKPGLTPFTLDYLVITNGSFPSTGSSPPNSGGGSDGNSPSGKSSTSNSPSPANNLSKSSSHVGSIVGGAVGGIGAVVVCSIIFFFFWFRSRRRRQRNHLNEVRRSVLEPFPVQSQFVSQTAPLLAANQATETQSTSSYSQSQPSMNQFSSALSPNNTDPLYTCTTDELSGSSRPLPTIPPTQFSPSRPRKDAMPIHEPAATMAPVQHADSGIRLPQPVSNDIIAEIPPTYSEL